MKSETIVEVAGLRKAFGTKRVLTGVDIEIERGSVFALLGPNGAGKTTTLNILSTLVGPDGGTVRIDGHDLHERAAVRRAISVTGQSTAVDALLTGRENLTLMAKLRRIPKPEIGSKIDQALADFGLGDAADERVGHYSGGMRRKLDIAISLLTRPKLLFLDEPTTGLDPHSRRDVWSRIRSLVKEGVTVLLTTQYLEEADHLADRIAVLDGGRIIAEGSPEELKRRVGADVVEVEYRDGTTRSVPTDGSPAMLRRVLDNMEESAITALRVRTSSLDDVFLAITGRTAATARGDASRAEAQV